MEDGTIEFGPYRLLVRGRSLLDGDRPVALGSRALDLLIALVEQAGEIVGKEDLIRKVWPETFVDESNLRVNIATLRRALDQGGSDTRYIINVPGRGYSFIAPITRTETSADVQAPPPRPDRVRNLPVRLVRTIGRDQVVEAIARQLPETRFVTIVGPGGIGKTTVGLAVAESLDGRYPEPARFIDLATIADPRVLLNTVASALGIPTQGDEHLAGLVAGLRDRSMLLVLDNCEHVLEQAAILAEAVLPHAPRLHLLTTSREPMRANGEWVHRLTPLDAPPAESVTNARDALTFPAVELFVERAKARLDTFELSNANAPVIGEICRRLDGIPLAIEFAAATVDVFGIAELRQRLDDCFALLIRGRRTALPRHKTLRATLDWSHGLLSEDERAVLRRLSVFRGGFTLGAALAVVPLDDLAEPNIPGILCDLVAKSLVIAELGQGEDRYRLLHTTRAYAAERLADAGECDAVDRWITRYLIAFLADSDVDSDNRSPSEWRAVYGLLIDDIRTALDWSFSTAGDTALGVELTAVSVAVWFRMSLMREFRDRAIKALDHVDRGSRQGLDLETRLTLALGHANWHIIGPGPEMVEAFSRAFEIAERFGDRKCQMQALWGLWTERNVFGDYTAATELAENYAAIAVDDVDDRSRIVSDRMRALSLHFTGQQSAAKLHAERALAHSFTQADRPNLKAFQFDLRAGTSAVLCRILWILGYPDQSAAAAKTSVETATTLGHTLSQCFALYSACMAAMWAGDRAEAEVHTARLLDQASKHNLAFWEAWGRSYQTVLAMARIDGDRPACVPTQDWRNPICGAQLPEAMTTFHAPLVDRALVARIEDNPNNWCAAEVLRADGEALLRLGGADAETRAEARFRQSLEIARNQGALSWELRTATSLARLRVAQRRDADARTLLAGVLDRFTEGHGTADVMAATELLGGLKRAHRAA